MVKITKVEEKNNEKNDFMSLAGILTDEEANKIKKMVYKGRRDGSRYKKYLAKW